MAEDENKESADSERIRKSLSQIVEQLEPAPGSSGGWGRVLSEHRAQWEELKKQIHERQSSLKALVRRKRAGEITPEEFEAQYQQIQDELTELEFRVYNLRLGTDVRP